MLFGSLSPVTGQDRSSERRALLDRLSEILAGRLSDRRSF